MYKTVGKYIKQWGFVNVFPINSSLNMIISRDVNLTSTDVIRVLGVGNCQEVTAFHDFSQGRG